MENTFETILTMASSLSPQHTGTSTKAEEESNASVKSELEEINKQASENKADVVKKLLDAVSTPSPKLHLNAQ